MGSRGRRRRCRSVRTLAVLAVLAVLTACSSGPPPHPPTSPAGSTGPSDTASPAKVVWTGSTISAVGPIFHHGLDQLHECTATVLAGGDGDLAITAAHCLTGTGTGLLFAPGYNRGATPFGVWSVRQVYVDAGWVADRDPDDDFAILRLADQTVAGRAQPVSGRTGGVALGVAPAVGSVITAAAYNGGSDDLPLRCRATVYYTGDDPTFDCAGYVSGSSGSPWLAGTPLTVRGVIGGLHAGGCRDDTSYSAPFGPRVFALLTRAERGTAPDTVPSAGSDGC